MTRHKYRAKPKTIDGIKFSSIKEANRYAELKLLEKAQEITYLKLQPSFTLLESFKYQGETIRGMKYTADYYYIDKEGNEVIEETKGFKTTDYTMRKKLFLHKYGERYVFIET